MTLPLFDYLHHLQPVDRTLPSAYLPLQLAVGPFVHASQLVSFLSVYLISLFSFNFPILL